MTEQEPLPASVIDKLPSIIDSLSMTYWKEILMHYKIPIVKNHLISREVLKKALSDLQEAVAGV
jgi:hypothetical protein